MNIMENNKNTLIKEAGVLPKKSSNSFLMPTKKTEYWQYTDLTSIAQKEYQYSSQSSTDFNTDFNGYKIFFENGYFQPKKSSLPEGVEVLPLLEAIILKKTTQFIDMAATTKNFFINKNDQNLQEGVFICISKNVELKKPIAIINYSNQNNTWHAIRNIIVLEQSSSAEIFEHFISHNDCFSNIVNEIFIDANAKLTHYKLIANASNHISNSFINIKKDGFYNNITLQANNALSRNEAQINLLEKGAHADYNAIYKGNDRHIIDNTVHVIHSDKDTTSNQLIKGVAGGFSSAVYQGKISINKGCDNVAGNQQHRAIIISDSAEVNVKPELEIFNDDVKCSHGSAIGKLDEKALFYLQSRGISEADAKALLIEAFLQEIIEKVQNLDIKESFLLAI